MDVLEDHLVRARASGAVFARTVLTAPWGVRLPGDGQLAVHAVVRGRALLWLDDPRDAVDLGAGGLALVRGGPDQHLAHDAGAPCVGLEEFRRRYDGDRAAGTAVDADEPGADRTVLVCGVYRFAGDVGRGLLEALPPVLPLSATHDDRLEGVIGLLHAELAGPGPAQQVVLDRLLDVLLVIALRSWFREGGCGVPGWYRASVDPRLGPALRAVHADAGHPWTVTELADLGGMSRAAFARAFGEVLGQAPMRYVTEWRMTLARDLLREGDLALGQIATRTGYASAYAFATAFRRWHGEAPGRWRARVRAGVANAAAGRDAEGADRPRPAVAGAGATRS